MIKKLLSSQVGKTVFFSDQFDEPVLLEDVRPLDKNEAAGYECRVRLPNGVLAEVVVSTDEVRQALGTEDKASLYPVDAERLRLIIESTRIRLAFYFDRQFAVSLSSIRTLPHQIEAVYLRMLSQPNLRFLLADDPGAGKTIMAGLLIKELKLREAIDRCLILVPASLTIQWQDELINFFNEPFQIINSANDQQQYLNLWERESQIITSIDYVKQVSVRERLLGQQWDLVIIDEAHKCSAYTKRRVGRIHEVERTKRYQLAERLAEQCDNLLLLTATPHHGDDDRFAHFIRLLDSDLFPEPHRLSEESRNIRRDIFKLGKNCPWSLRRLKEDLKDMHGRRLFPDRHVHTVSFNLGTEEYRIYSAVSNYINEYLPHTTGPRKSSVALARTVFQRRLASSIHAIHKSLSRRLSKLNDLVSELEVMSPSERSVRFATIRDRLPDSEQDEDDLDETTRDELLDEATATAELGQLRAEIMELTDLVDEVGKVRETGTDSKLTALRECLFRSEFTELKDGRGKLLIFTEHRDTLNHLQKNINTWGYSNCQIHGAMTQKDRKSAERDFRTSSQICIATEAAGEGINLQFCHLMINYDLPWNPTRLEQRLGRIHRIGQVRDVHAFNFVATSSEDGQPVIEGRILERLLEKLERMRAALGDRVFDVIGEVLSLNQVNLPDILRDVAYDPRQLEDYLDVIDHIDSDLLKNYEEATGIALARSHVDFSTVARSNLEAEERHLMPRYVEAHFLLAANAVGLRVEPRADGLWKVDHVNADLRSDRLSAVQRFGKPDANYRKLTFYKDHLEREQHVDAELLGPGHPLYAAVDEKIQTLLHDVIGKTAVFADVETTKPYWLHFHEISIEGSTRSGELTTTHAELVAVREEIDDDIDLPNRERFSSVPADALIDLPPHPRPPSELPEVDHTRATDYLKSTVQMERRREGQLERNRYADVVKSYLERSFSARIRLAQDRVMEMSSLETEKSEFALARRRAEQDLADIEDRKKQRLEGIKRLRIARHGPVRRIASCLVLPPETTASRSSQRDGYRDDALIQRIERAAEDIVVAYEETQQRECERVGHLKIGFDIRSLEHPDPQTGLLDPVTGVRRIEVKGRKRGGSIRLTTNEWYKAQQLGDSYWLYVVWDPLENSSTTPVMIQNPAKHLDYAKQEVVAARYYDVPAKAVVETAAQVQSEILTK